MATERFELEKILNQRNEFRFESDRLGFEAIRLSSGLSEGVIVVTLWSGDLQTTVIPTRGMGIWEASYKGVRFGWNSPVRGPVHPKFVPLSEPSGLGWLDGFDELVVRCGLTSNGAPEFDPQGKLIWPLHGRIANLPAVNTAITVDSNEGKIAITGSVIETRFLFYNWELESTITLQTESNEVLINDRVVNRSERIQSMQLLYHCNFGPPLLAAGSRLVAATKQVVPRDQQAVEGLDHWNHFGAPEPGFQEQVYFVELEKDHDGFSKVVLVNADSTLAASVRYQAETLPCFTLWKNTAALGDGYVVGLEPATNYPNIRSVEEQAGRIESLEPNTGLETLVAIGLLVGGDQVELAMG